MERMKTAVFGCGKISDIYIANMQKFDILDLVCCAATTLEHAQAKAEQYGLQARTVDDILSDASIELIVNLTPPKAHYDLIKRALLAGKHVFTEKALTSDLEEARELLKLADEKRLYLGCAPETFMGGAVQAARRDRPVWGYRHDHGVPCLHQSEPRHDVSDLPVLGPRGRGHRDGSRHLLPHRYVFHHGAGR